MCKREGASLIELYSTRNNLHMLSGLIISVTRRMALYPIHVPRISFITAAAQQEDAINGGSALMQRCHIRFSLS